MKSNVTKELLKEYFEYRNGHLWWIKPSGPRVKSGYQFGTDRRDGYRHGKFFGKRYLEHRLIWLYHYGNWPKDLLDHTNGIKHDNRIENLREATRKQNSYNRKSSKGASSKYKGVHWSKAKQKWVSQYTDGDKNYHLGYYNTELEAAKAYRKATEELHKEYQNYG